MSDWHKLTPPQAMEKLGGAPEGLSLEEAAARLERHGPNELLQRGLKSPWLILYEQLTGVLVIVLLVAAAVSAVMGYIDERSKPQPGWAEGYSDAIAIVVIVILNALLGLTQEYRAEKAMAALKRMAAPTVRVRRGGQVMEIPSRQIVPGDILLLEAGNIVPADCRLIEAVNLRIQESALTGESEPVEKDTQPLPQDDLTLGDRADMAFMGTVVTYGRGAGVVTATGMGTELGAVAAMIQTVHREPTPLQRRLEQLGKGLALAALVLVAVIFAQGLLIEGVNLANVEKMFLVAVSMAVAAVPEGLPAVVTIALALGAQRMLRRRALIRKLLAVETLGSVTVICSDKTGTLTENRMTVTVLDAAGDRIDLVEELRRGEPVAHTGAHPLLGRNPTLSLLLAGGALCNDASLHPLAGQTGQLQAVGDPTEGALVVAAAQMGLWKDRLEKLAPRVAELPFDSQRKRMTTVHRRPGQEAQLPLPPGGYVAFCKGAVDGLLTVCTHLWQEGQPLPLDQNRRQEILTANDELARQGMRVLGVALRLLDQVPPPQQMESELVFVGLAGMIDPPRPEVRQAVETCRAAGIRVVMITGDHPLTARHIAGQLGIEGGSELLTGIELQRMAPGELAGKVGSVGVYARVSPEHKLKIVEALQAQGQIVAMTGDGVNDAPALRKSDIGVAMGVTGTDVAKEAADMVLQDDNFATIVAAVEEGRVIYDNIRKFIKYLLSCNSGELWVMIICRLMGMPLPLLPLQILFMNLVTDGLPALALGVEPAERDTMRRPPHDPRQSVFRGMVADIIWMGLMMAMVSLAAAGYCWFFRDSRFDPAVLVRFGDAAAAKEAFFRTMVFTTLTLSQMALVLAQRSSIDSLFRQGLLSNKPLLAAVASTVLLQLAAVYLPAAQEFFRTIALPAGDLAVALGLSAVPFVVVELYKLILRRRRR